MTNRSRSPSKFPIGRLKEIPPLVCVCPTNHSLFSKYQPPSILLQKIHWNWKFEPTQASKLLVSNNSILHWMTASSIRSLYTLHQSAPRGLHSSILLPSSATIQLCLIWRRFPSLFWAMRAIPTPLPSLFDFLIILSTWCMILISVCF